MSAQRMDELGVALQAKIDADASAEELLVAAMAIDLEALRPAVEEGDAEALLRALQMVAHEGMAMPGWLGLRLGRAIDKYRDHRARTLDDAFGVHRPKGYHQNANRERWRKAPTIVFDALKLHARGVPIGDGMFDALGQLHGAGKTRTAEYFYLHQKRRTVTYRAAEITKDMELSPKLSELLSLLQVRE